MQATRLANNFFLRTHIISPLIHNDNSLSTISQSNFSPKPNENFSESNHSSNITPNITHLKTQSSNKFRVNISGFIKVKTRNWDAKLRPKNISQKFQLTQKGYHQSHQNAITITIPQPQPPFQFTNNNSIALIQNNMYKMRTISIQT